MDFRLFENIIDSFSPTLFYLNLYFQGEPFLHPSFTDMVKYAKSKGIIVATSTNGHYLDSENAKKTIESGLDTLIVSLDGADETTYQQYRNGGKFIEVISGIKEIVKQKVIAGSNKPRIILQSLMLKSNSEQFKEIRQLGKELGVDKVEFKTAQFYEFENGNPLMPDESFSRYKRVVGSSKETVQYKIRNRMPNHCFRMWSSAVITWDRKMVPCCFDKDASLVMGDLNKDSMIDSWKNETYKEFRKKILRSRKSIDICRNCSEGTGISLFF